MSNPGRKWIVGLDLRPRSQGAMCFAAWLSERAGEDRPETMVGIHVIEDDHMRAAVRYHQPDEVIKAAREATDMVVNRVGVTDALDEIHIVQGKAPETSLEAALTYHHADGLILGRYAEIDSASLRRLGRVARRVLRSLGSPVVVVPPDWQRPDDAAAGPVIASCNMKDDSSASVRQAAALAERLGVELILVHVVPLPHDYGANYLPSESLEELRSEHVADAEQTLQTFAEGLGLSSCRREIREGSIVEGLVQSARDAGASMISTGSRRLSTLERVLLTSIGSELAATAACPVMVVPPS